MKRSVSLLGGALVVALPLLVLLPGCSGGSGIFSPHSPGSPTATGTPNSIALLTDAQIDLGNGQIAFLTVSRSGNNVSGNLTVGASNAHMKTRGQVKTRAQALVFAVPEGVYPVTGTFSAPRGLTLAGTFPAPVGAFSFTGTLPTSTEDGSYSVTVGGQTASGTLLHGGGIVLPTATPTGHATATPTVQGTATATPVPGEISATANLIFSNVQGTTTDTSTFNQVGVVTSNYQNAGFTNFFFDIRQGDGPTRRFNARLSNFPYQTGPIQQGNVFTFSGATATSHLYYRANGSDAEWDADNGTILLQKVQGNSFTFQFQNVHFTAADNGATGSFNVTGPVTIANPDKLG